MTGKKLLSFTLAIMLVCALPVSALAADYSDTGQHWANAEIQTWSDHGVLQGANGRFRPDDPITRGELAVILNRVMRYQEKAGNSFTDLGNEFYTDAILRANRAGVILGSGSSVRPRDGITREEAAVMLGRALRIDESTSASAFTDRASISTWAVGYVNALAARGIINGRPDGSFAPKAGITRAEVVKILDNAIKGFYTTAGEYSEDVTGMAVVNAPGVTLKDMKISGDLILADGIGEGDVTLDGISVTGKTVVRGGGRNSVHVTNSTTLNEVTVEKIFGGVSIKVTGGADISVVVAEDGTVYLSGTFENLEVSGGDVVLVNANVINLNVKSPDANVTIDGGSMVTNLNVTGEGGHINNNGAVTNLNVDADGLVFDGSKPSNVKIGDDVEDPPKDGAGALLPETPATGGGGGGGGGGGTPSGPRVKLESGSEGTAGDQKIIVKAGNIYKVDVTEPDDTKSTRYVTAEGTLEDDITKSAPISGTEITRLDNDNTYKVTSAKPISSVTVLPHNNPGNMPPPDGEQPSPTAIENGTVTIDKKAYDNVKWGVMFDLTSAQLGERGSSTAKYARTKGPNPFTGTSTGFEEGAFVYTDDLEPPVTWNNYADNRPYTSGPAVYDFDVAGQTATPGYIDGHLIVYLGDYEQVSWQLFDLANGDFRYLKVVVTGDAVTPSGAEPNDFTIVREINDAADAAAIVHLLDAIHEAYKFTPNDTSALELTPYYLEAYDNLTNDGKEAVAKAILREEPYPENKTGAIAIKAIFNEAVRAEMEKDLADVTGLRDFLNGATYTAVPQDEANTEAAALTKAQAQVDAYVEGYLEAYLADDMTVTFSPGTFTAATKGTEQNQNGTDGSFTFAVTVEKGNALATTSTLTMPITATPAVFITKDGGEGTAGIGRIYGLTSGSIYKVEVRSGDDDPETWYVDGDGELNKKIANAEPLKGTAIPLLDNGKTYKVTSAKAMTGEVWVLWHDGDDANNMPPETLEGTFKETIAADGTVTIDTAPEDVNNIQWGVMFELTGDQFKNGATARYACTEGTNPFTGTGTGFTDGMFAYKDGETWKDYVTETTVPDGTPKVYHFTMDNPVPSYIGGRFIMYLGDGEQLSWRLFDLEDGTFCYLIIKVTEDAKTPTSASP